MCVKNGGMPIKGDPYSNGRLFIVFNVIYPLKGEIDTKRKGYLQQIFNIPSYKRFINRKNNEKDLPEDSDIEFQTLIKVNPESFGKQTNRKTAHDSDSDEDEPQGERCRTM